MTRIFRLLAVSTLGLGLSAGLSYAGAGGAGGGKAGARATAGAAKVGRANGAGRAGPKAASAATPAERIDKREANQAKRIDAGIAKGQLTSDEVTRLQGMETHIDTLEGNFKSDGKLSKDEVKQLRQALDEASLQIWSERHDTEGNQKPVSRLGKDVFAQDQLTTKLESPDLTKAQARAFLEDFHKMVNLKRRLAGDDLTADQRTKLQAEYNELLNQYFLQK